MVISEEKKGCELAICRSVAKLLYIYIVYVTMNAKKSVVTHNHSIYRYTRKLIIMCWNWNWN